MHLKEARMAVQRIGDLDLAALTRREFFPSPDAWEDQVLYFLMLDRFSNGDERGYRGNDGRLVAAGSIAPFEPGDAESAVGTEAEAAAWREAGGRWVGGTLAGLTSKLGYLARLGVTAIWVSPVFKQVAFQPTYHGYGIQNFLDVDPHFGTADDLRDLARVAHEHGIRVILDIILNHTGNVFAYDADRYPTDDGHGGQVMDPRWDGHPYRVRGFRDAGGDPSLPFGPVDLGAFPRAWPDGALWPGELQDAATFSRRGRISNWDHDPEFLEGDFLDLKNVTLGERALDATGREEPDQYRPSPALAHLIAIYRWWIAFADLDGFRIDTVKHMELGATRIFASAIHEFATSIGKERFFLVGEITGGRVRAYTTLEQTGLDAALGIDDIPDRLEWLVKGYREPAEYFDLFRNSLLVRKDSHTWFRDKVVTLYDDHDQVRKGDAKARFRADALGKRLALNALALNATTLGIPCIYYGSEQGFDGQGRGDGADRYIREAMFGGAFGAFRSRDRHCFDEDGPLYRELAAVLTLRRQRLALRRGRQYLRPISGNGVDFGTPRLFGRELRSIVPWSRIFVDDEVLLAINTDPQSATTAWVTIDDGLHAAGDELRCLYSTDHGQVGQAVQVEARNGKAVRLSVPAAGFAAYA
jgi:glycosidase